MPEGARKLKLGCKLKRAKYYCSTMGWDGTLAFFALAGESGT